MAVNNKTNNEALDAMYQKLDVSWMSGDIDGFMDAFTDEVIWMPPNQAPVVGKQACSEWVLQNNSRLFGDDKENVFESFTIDLEEIVLSSDIGYLWHTITMVMPADENGNNLTARLKGLESLEKQSDGEWKISRYMWNSYPIG